MCLDAPARWGIARTSKAPRHGANLGDLLRDRILPSSLARVRGKSLHSARLSRDSRAREQREAWGADIRVKSGGCPEDVRRMSGGPPSPSRADHVTIT